MKRTMLAVMLSAAGVLPQTAALAGGVDVGFSVRTANAQVAVSASNGSSVWVPGTWENQGGQWVWREGYWRTASAPVPAPVYHTAEPVEVVYAEAPPPAPMVEVQPVAPHAHAVWIPGHWRWHHRRHVWIGGRWDVARPGYVYEAPRWSRHQHRWAWAPGGWRRAAYHNGHGHGGYARNDRDWNRHDNKGYHRGHDRDRGHDRGRGHHRGHGGHHRHR